MPSTHTDVLLAGALAAFSVDLIVYPLDTLKTRFQSPDYQKLYYNATRTAINHRVLFSGLYQGVGSVILITIPSSGAFFTTYEAVKSILSKANTTLGNSPVPQPFIHSTASAVAELVACFILTPAEVLKQNAQMIRQPVGASGFRPSSLFERSVTLQVLRNFNRPTQLWRGYTALAGRNLPFTAMQFPMFEHLRTSIKEYRNQCGTYTGSLLETGLITGVSAGSAGAIAAVITTPIDVIKTRIMLSAATERSGKNGQQVINGSSMQANRSHASVEQVTKSRKTSLAIARDVIREAGIKGLFRGGIFRAVWTALGSGLYLAIYESGKLWLGENRATGDG